MNRLRVLRPKNNAPGANEQTRQQWMRDYGQDVESWAHFMDGYQPGGDQGMYKFRCRHCGLVVFNWDFS